MKKNQDEEINKEIVKSVISRGIPVEKFFELGGEIIKLDSSPNSTHVNVFEMAGIDPKKVEEVLKNQIILIIIYLTRKSARWSKPIRSGECLTKIVVLHLPGVGRLFFMRVIQNGND